MADQWTVIHADRAVIGTDSDAIDQCTVVIHNDTITDVDRQDRVKLPTGSDVRTIHLKPGQTVTPGMVDVHTHLVMPGDGTSYQAFMQHSDGVLLLQAMQNAWRHLWSGVTTVTDTGARGTVTFTLRDAISAGIVDGPRLVLCGRPITRTGGHCWFLGAEADGATEITATARQLLKEGADIIKVMATGGGTVGTDPFRPSLSVDELAAAVAEAHANGKRAIAHVSATEGITRTLDAKVDVIFHSHFYNPDGTLTYQPDIAGRIAGEGVWVNPTLHVNGVYVERLEQKAESNGLCAEETAELETRRTRYAGQKENVGRLVDQGVKLVAGSDAGWGRYEFGDLVTELEQMVQVGIRPGEAVIAATSRAAEAIGVGDQVGSLCTGKQADLLVVNGDPTVDICALRNVAMVMLGGRMVRQEPMDPQ